MAPPLIDLLRYHHAIYRHRSPVDSDVVASAVLVKYGHFHFSVTAKHVFEEFAPEELAIFLEDPGEGVPYYRLRSVFPVDTPFDFAITSLPQDVVEPLRKEYLFYDLSPATHCPASELVGIGHIVGYPCSKQKILTWRQGKGVRQKSFPYVVEAPFMSGTNFLPQFQRDRYCVNSWHSKDARYFNVINGRTCEPPKAVGMSGGGVWQIQGMNIGTQTFESARLCGITMERHPRNKPIALVGTRIEVVVSFIRRFLLEVFTC
jgi:hypothetical protein